MDPDVHAGLSIVAMVFCVSAVFPMFAILAFVSMAHKKAAGGREQRGNT